MGTQPDLDKVLSIPTYLSQSLVVWRLRKKLFATRSKKVGGKVDPLLLITVLTMLFQEQRFYFYFIKLRLYYAEIFLCQQSITSASSVSGEK